MNIFITGTTGFLGKNLLSHLLAVLKPEDRIFLTIRKEFRYDDKRITPLVGDLSDISRFKEEILSCEYVYHLAANATFGSDFDYDKVNYEPTIRIVDMLKESSHLRNFIFTSTIGAVDREKGDRCETPLTVKSIPSPTSLYGKSKLKAEEYVRKSGIPYTIIRPTWVYGRNMRTNSHINRFVSMVYQDSLAVKLNFPGKVSLIHIDDLSKALVRCIDNKQVVNRVYFAEAESLSIGDILKTIYIKVNKREPKQIKVPRLHFILGRMHSKLPLAISNLFINYLYARDEDFKKDFDVKEIKPFADYVDDVISTNINNGYWVVTGANSGIGYALAKKLDSLNKKLVLIDKDTDNIISFGRHVVVKTDLSNIEELSKLAKEIEEYRIFCLINNAGIGFRGSIRDLSPEHIKKTIDVNVCYPVFFTKLLIDNLTRDESGIVNVASSIAYNPLPHMSVYSASKAFLANWSESLTYELKSTNKVITISPSGTFTNFQKTAGVKVSNRGKGLLTPEYVAEKIIRAVHGKRNVIVLGGKTKLLLMISKFLSRKLNIFFWGRLFEKIR